MRNFKQMGWLATAAATLLWSAMSFAQAGGAYPQGGGAMGAPGARGTMGNPTGTGAYPGQVGTMGNIPADAQMGAMDDKAFMKKAAEGGLAEVQLGQLAQENGQNQEVKDFGQRMVTDHTKANDQLKQVATQQNVTLPTSPSAHDQAEYNKLQKLHGDAFDKAYSKMMVSDHKKDIAEFKREASSGNDSQLKSFASQTLPTLEEHLQMAEKMNSKSSGHGSAGGGSSPSQ